MAALSLAGVLAGSALAGPRWDDVTAQAGIAYREAGEVHKVPTEPHEVPEIEWPAFPEIIGGGACWADVDDDGYDDLYVVNQRFNDLNPNFGAWAHDVDTRSRLFLNDGDGTFTDATDGSGADANAFGYGCSAADYDADGCMDLVVTNFGPSYLYRGGCDGTFTNATAALGVVGEEGACGAFTCFSTGSGWADYDRDGDVDLYIANYVESTLDDNVRGPLDHVGQLNFLLRNDGGTFAEVAQSVGAAGYHEVLNGSKSFGVAWFDYDRNGWPDLYVTNDEAPNNLFHNNGDGTFTERAEAAGVIDRRAGMGLTAGDYDNDGWPDLYFTHYQTETHGFYRNLHDGTFQNRSGEDGLREATNRVGWGTRFVDYDRDGWLDIVSANGHTEWFVDNYLEDVQAFHNEAEASPAEPGDRFWVDASNDTGVGFPGVLRVHRGLAFGDYDLDGDVDLFRVPNGNQTAVLDAGSGVTNHWLYLQLRQTGGNRDALGAVVTVTAGGLTQVREHYPGQSFLSQNSLLRDIGLGSATQADVEVRWPDGSTTSLQGVPADRVVRIVQGVPGYVTDTLAPRTTASVVGEGHAGWFRGTVTATVAAAERAVGPASGLVGTEVSVDGGPWTAYGGETIVFTTEALHTLRMRSVDAAGNQEPPRLVRIPMDETPPTPTHAVAGVQGIDGWLLTDATVTLGGLDAVSGPGDIRYRVGEGEWRGYAGPFVLGDGIHDIAFVVADVAGNEAASAFQVRVDTTPPAVAVASPAAGALHLAGAAVAQLPAGPALVLRVGDASFPVQADAADGTSGVAVVRFLLDGATLGVDTTAPYEVPWDTAATDDGLHVLEVFATDAAGNAAYASVHVLLVAPEPPPAPDIGGLLSDLGFQLPLPAPLVVAPLWARRRLRP